MEIIPAIIGKDIKEIKEKIDLVLGLVKWVQIDIMDGKFAPTKSWPYTGGEVEDLESIDAVRREDIKVEIHLMVEKPEDVIQQYIDYGADRIVVHLEATNKMPDILQTLRDAEVESGIALKMETKVGDIYSFVEDLDVIQFMSIDKIGMHGQPFDEKVCAKISTLKNKYPGVAISVDGGINLENAPKLAALGVENIVIGSAIYRAEDIAKAIIDFKNI